MCLSGSGGILYTPDELGVAVQRKGSLHDEREQGGNAQRGGIRYVDLPDSLARGVHAVPGVPSVSEELSASSVVFSFPFFPAIPNLLSLPSLLIPLTA